MKATMDGLQTGWPKRHAKLKCYGSQVGNNFY